MHVMPTHIFRITHEIAMLLLISVFTLGLICFYICFKSIDIFEKI